MSAFFAKCLFAGVAGLVVGHANANSNLRATAHGAQENVSTAAVRRSFLSELGSLHSGRIEQLEASLQPMFLALPKGAHGYLEPAAVRYAMHRFFVQRHGWYINGLEPAGGSWNTSSPMEITKERVPAFIQGLFEERLSGGFGLHELAVFAATLEDLVRDEATRHLEDVYRVLEIPMMGHSRPHVVDQAIMAYMMIFIIGGNLQGQTQADVNRQLQEMTEVYPNWMDTMSWALDVQHNVEYASRDLRNPFRDATMDFAAVSGVVNDIGERFGKFQNLECHSLKDALMEIEYKGTGRVRLSDFYRGGLGGQWQFTESVDYLRTLGALDESDPRRPSVIITNYIGSQSNCLASSNLYSVCCLDECEGLLGHLERRIAAPSGSPREIAEIVAALPSDTVEAPRNLTTELLDRLQRIADRHSGRVPLHGRLFAQWMHHAYPRECPFPHEAGTTHPLTPDEWMNESGQVSVTASEEEMRRHLSEVHHDAVYMTPHAKADVLPWIDVEELVIPHHIAAHTPASSGLSALRGCFFVAAAASVAVHLFRTAKTAKNVLPTHYYGSDKRYV